jgi:hypothetical protein
MKKNDKTKKIIIIAIVALVGLFLLFSSVKDSLTTTTPSTGKTTIGEKITDIFNGGGAYEDRGYNGWYNPETDECWTTPTSMSGGTGVTTCCRNDAGQQIDCEDPTKLLTNALGNTLGTFAIYTPVTPSGSTKSLAYVNHVVTITNSKNYDFEKVWFENFTFTSSPTNAVGLAEVHSDWWPKTTINNGQLLPSGSSVSWSTSSIDLQKLSVNKDTPTTYSANIQTKGSYYALENGTTLMYYTPATTPISFRVTKEEVGFTVVVNLG